MAGNLGLTPARLRVLTSAAEGHIVRSRWGVGNDKHSGRQGCQCNLRSGQTVKQQVSWLIHNGLLEHGEDTGAHSWTWRPTSAGWAALGRNPS